MKNVFAQFIRHLLNKKIYNKEKKYGLRKRIIKTSRTMERQN